MKFIENDKFIFFSNYNSPKANAFDKHNQICALFFWQSINIQIRIKGEVYKTSREFNKEYFKKRSKSKNALAISSNQSQVISDFNQIKLKYDDVKDNSNLSECPDYWGGFYFIPYSFEFWKGNDFRINRRDLYKKQIKGWDHFILEP